MPRSCFTEQPSGDATHTTERARIAGAVASAYGYDIESDKVRSMVMCALLGDPEQVRSILASGGVNVATGSVIVACTGEVAPPNAAIDVKGGSSNNEGGDGSVGTVDGGGDDEEEQGGGRGGEDESRDGENVPNAFGTIDDTNATTEAACDDAADNNGGTTGASNFAAEDNTSKDTPQQQAAAVKGVLASIAVDDAPPELNLILHATLSNTTTTATLQGVELLVVENLMLAAGVQMSAEAVSKLALGAAAAVAVESYSLQSTFDCAKAMFARPELPPLPEAASTTGCETAGDESSGVAVAPLDAPEKQAARSAGNEIVSADADADAAPAATPRRLYGWSPCLGVIPRHEPAIYLPRVFENIDERTLQTLLQKAVLGNSDVARIELLPITDQDAGDGFNRAIVHLNAWDVADPEVAAARLALLVTGESTVVYDDPWFFMLRRKLLLFFPYRRSCTHAPTTHFAALAAVGVAGDCGCARGSGSSARSGSNRNGIIPVLTGFGPGVLPRG